ARAAACPGRRKTVRPSCLPTSLNRRAQRTQQLDVDERVGRLCNQLERQSRSLSDVQKAFRSVGLVEDPQQCMLELTRMTSAGRPKQAALTEARFALRT